MKKYTLDQIVSDQYVFLERPNETNQLVIPKKLIKLDLIEGEIVTINSLDGGYKIEIMKKETDDAYDKVNALLEKLQKKNK